MVSCNNDECESANAEFTYEQSAMNSASCVWNEGLDVLNPKPILASGAQAGIFSATPAGLVFVSSTTGEIDLETSKPGTYTVTNVIADCGVSATTEFVLLPGEELEVEEVNFPTSNPDIVVHYYRFLQTATHPELKDETKYQYKWYEVMASGEIKDVQDMLNLWESLGHSGMAYYVDNNPKTGVPRNDTALIVDVTNVETGCTKRFAFGKPISELPEPGRSL